MKQRTKSQFLNCFEENKNRSRMNQSLPGKITLPLHPETYMNEPAMCKSSIGFRASLGLKFFVTKDNLELSWKIKLKRGNVKLRREKNQIFVALKKSLCNKLEPTANVINKF